MTMGVLDVREITKSYGDFTLGPISISFRPGRVCGLLGPNGAGKTTLLQLLTQQIRPTSGALEHGGLVVTWREARWREQVAFVAETPAFYDELTVGATLQLAARVHALWDRDREVRLVERFGIDRCRKVGTLSKGSKVKLAIVAALSHRAEWVVLDEPSAGLDPSARAALQSTLRDLMAECPGLGMVLSSHLFDDLDAVADDLLVLRGGRVVFASTLNVFRQAVVFQLPVPVPIDLIDDVRWQWTDVRGAVVVVEAGSRAADRLRQIPGYIEHSHDVLSVVYHATEGR